ncbi:hypothetical protein PN465_14445 [Nodularia spumigena CS-584]|uniref:Uncharacterized protein n=1 Tax=Nodularia spumigena UHCC 0060 TaxID=3110300 RepID=A0ABU5UN36_NODSP|nr:hypothetical protein [Nodularia spumigena]MDB9383409.1 hypothetical protein [Nodularia spumigena CS-584]MEA5524380.1 hypothetical protein [Nodularia spumigena UHCC 0143]MEA5558720.1 hypothetical protein [Nodularia spumigena CH309]MEA5607696.1 hypothetical protein [Nodularia spumigena UHCC 0060]MEA5614166.1 hypothetical protein [Nodularia spumigena UHCC 0040]
MTRSVFSEGSPHFHKLSDHLRGLTGNQGFQPAYAGFACVAAIYNRLVLDMSFPIPSSSHPALSMYHPSQTR